MEELSCFEWKTGTASQQFWNKLHWPPAARNAKTHCHLLIAPLQHQATLLEIDSPVLLDLQQLLAAWCQRLTKAIEAQGFNIGLNLGQVAGAGVPGHLHWHLVPRWPGDVNFMTSVAGVRVIPQALDDLWDQLRACL